MTARYIVGDTRDVTASLPDGSVDLVMTSPPFLALRSYLPADHPDKHREIGSEATPAEFLQVLLELTAEWGRVLAPHGSIVVELGDTYAGSGGGGGDYNADGLRDGQPKFDGSGKRVRETRREGYILDGIEPPMRRDISSGWPLDKSLCGIPHLYHLSLAYGRNLLTGDPSPAGQWRVRNVVAWCRPNPPVGALGDKFRPGTSYLTVATRSRTRYFDLDAVRTEAIDQRTRTTNGPKSKAADSAEVQTGNYTERVPSNPAGAPPLDFWVIPTAPYAGSHYATYPAALCERPIKAMCPLRVCTVCGEPSRRITSEPEYVGQDGQPVEPRDRDKAQTIATGFGGHSGKKDGGVTRTQETVGWTDCGHDSWRNGLVFDPFAGSGTTLAVATGHGRDAIGIDIDARNADLATERVGGLFLTVETFDPEAAA